MNKRLRSVTVLLLAAIPLTSLACAGDPKLGSTIAAVRDKNGDPDLIADRSGDLERIYPPTRLPKEAWPADVPRTYYYLGKDEQFTFVNGRVVDYGPINSVRQPQLVQLKHNFESKP